VQLPGAQATVADVMRGLTVFVLPSLSEATPVTLLEAMATGLPVVASRVGGVPQLVLEEETGCLVEPADVHALVAAIARYLDDPTLRARHGAAGRAHVVTRYSVEAMVAGYAALYNHALRARRRRLT
jgi:glycosyltransferase involved in cell wall biosynthesis